MLDEIDKLGPAPAAVLLEVLDPEQNDRFRDAFVELPFDLSEVLFLTTANETDQIPPALRDRLEIIDLPGYREDEKVRHRRDAPGRRAEPGRRAGGDAGPLHPRRLPAHHPRLHERAGGPSARPVPADGLPEGGARARDRRRVAGLERITAAQVRAFLGAPGAGHTDGLDRLGEQLDAAALPEAVRARGREVLARLAGLATADPEQASGREYLQCLVSLPWTKRAAEPSDLPCARAVLDAGHAGHGAVKERLLDYVAVRLATPDTPSPLLCLVGPPGVGKTSLAWLVAAALGRVPAWVACGELGRAADVHGARSGSPGRIVGELRRVGVRNPVFILDGIDRGRLRLLKVRLG